MIRGSFRNARDPEHPINNARFHTMMMDTKSLNMHCPLVANTNTQRGTHEEKAEQLNAETTERNEGFGRGNLDLNCSI